MISVEEAKLIIDKYVIKLGVESIPLSECGNRILSQDIIATFPSPQFDNSAMDGFAVKSVDILKATRDKPIQLKVIGVSSAGNPSKLIINSGECIQCMTGAKIPNGADTIIMVEDSSGFSESEYVNIFNNSDKGKHIRKMGEEIIKGELLISKGTRITPNEIGVCATFGYGEINVTKKPKIAIFGTGDELVEPGNKLSDGKIYNSNLYVLSELAKNCGAEIIYKNVIKDDKNSLRYFLLNAIKSCDIVISSGGVSMGKFDYIRDVFNELNIKEHFWKVAQKPGMPLFFGSSQNTLFFGLPGNPVSSYICFVQYVIPVIQEMLNEKRNKKLSATLINNFPVEKTKHRYLFGKSWINNNGDLICITTMKVGSHMLSSSLGANCIIESTNGDCDKKAGDKVIINLLNWRNMNDYN
jgi:molybdopterin molybdotransferase